MKKELKFEVTLDEYNCPGITSMTEEEVRECSIEFIKIESAAIIPQVVGQWSANNLGRGGTICVMMVFFQYEET